MSQAQARNLFRASPAWLFHLPVSCVQALSITSYAAKSKAMGRSGSSSRGSSCVCLARKRRKPRKAQKGNESAEANARSAEARGSTRKRQIISSQFGLLILITALVARSARLPDSHRLHSGRLWRPTAEPGVGMRGGAECRRFALETAGCWTRQGQSCRDLACTVNERSPTQKRTWQGCCLLLIPPSCVPFDKQ